ncbi:ATP:cob(I)alamin adenosyltransferase [candidate division WWE3 bacterium RIFCSPHIGHO2_01_FULL_40_23]|uniref:Corrinoid adenosyltransferase n=1 Tax=candidate division WWE3 bacterium RIFCSPLOWO2_01_FULL_41_18 TaxID=1802625 RepID=A0A1F4VCN5_UNCKA|nr:MAG: ATP:cob(I)alamin adenosyltransferase [candidate division WWE3 bacterium RIFCSPHIGHO2_01_FULL_40_23]OGC54924.1 MAG: ATP:cob(I)alamin adenosyltransferase [candidate division WWE3 bacterium RIFCSPLOWO2_01_FULL_41_18]
MKIYTKTGDEGKTSLFRGKRVSKDAKIIESLGCLDELNSALGVSISYIKLDEINLILTGVQRDLFTIGFVLPSLEEQVRTSSRLKRRTSFVEKCIDKYSAKVSKLSNFILPGGSVPSSSLHLTRSVCRRCERNIVSFSKEEKVSGSIIMYLNRLSDLLFTLARYVNKMENTKEFIWSKRDEF